MWIGQKFWKLCAMSPHSSSWQFLNGVLSCPISGGTLLATIMIFCIVRVLLTHETVQFVPSFPARQGLLAGLENHFPFHTDIIVFLSTLDYNPSLNIAVKIKQNMFLLFLYFMKFGWIIILFPFVIVLLTRMFLFSGPGFFATLSCPLPLVRPVARVAKAQR